MGRLEDEAQIAVLEAAHEANSKQFGKVVELQAKGASANQPEPDTDLKLEQQRQELINKDEEILESIRILHERMMGRLSP
jgi:hypothetical protein